LIRSSVEASTVARKLIEATRPLTRPGRDTVDLALTLTEAADSLGLARDGRPRFEFDHEPIPPVTGGAAELRAMFTALLANAVESDHDPAHPVLATARAEPGGPISIEIRDQGCGMSAEVLEHAFDPFFTTKPDHVGVGLNLAHSIWRRHRGSISLTSHPRQGTTVHLTMHTSAQTP
jgi:two-component system sensor histidine kinase DctS